MTVRCNRAGVKFIEALAEKVTQLQGRLQQKNRTKKMKKNVCLLIAKIVSDFQ